MLSDDEKAILKDAIAELLRRDPKLAVQVARMRRAAQDSSKAAKARDENSARLRRRVGL